MFGKILNLHDDIQGLTISKDEKRSLLFYHISSVIDFLSEKYICSTGHKDSWYLQNKLSGDT